MSYQPPDTKPTLNDFITEVQELVGRNWTPIVSRHEENVIASVDRGEWDPDAGCYQRVRMPRRFKRIIYTFSFLEPDS